MRVRVVSAVVATSSPLTIRVAGSPTPVTASRLAGQTPANLARGYAFLIDGVPPIFFETT